MSQKVYKSGSTFPELTKGLLRIYSNRLCPFAERTRLVLAHKNIPHEVVNIHLKEKPEWLLALSPAGKVPVIQLDDLILNESTAASEYLDDVYPGDRLQADDPYRKAVDRILLENFGQATMLFHFLSVLMWDDKNKDEIESHTAKLLQSYKFCEGELVKRDSQFFGGSKPGLIDYYLWPHIERVPTLAMLIPKLALTKSDYPKMSSWWEDMTQVPAVKKEFFDADWHYQVYKIRNEGLPYHDYGLVE